MNIIYQTYHGTLGEIEKRSIESVKQYAKRIGAHYHIETNIRYFEGCQLNMEKLAPYHPNFIFSNYNKIVVLDTDVYMNSKSDNIFDAFETYAAHYPEHIKYTDKPNGGVVCASHDFVMTIRDHALNVMEKKFNKRGRDRVQDEIILKSFGAKERLGPEWNLLYDPRLDEDINANIVHINSKGVEGLEKHFNEKLKVWMSK